MVLANPAYRERTRDAAWARSKQKQGGARDRVAVTILACHVFGVSGGAENHPGQAQRHKHEHKQ